MEKLKNIRDILLTAFVAFIGMIFIDSLVYRGLYSYFYLFLAVVTLVIIIIMSIIIYDNGASETIPLIETLKDGGSFKYSVCQVHKQTEKERTYIKYLRILNGID